MTESMNGTERSCKMRRVSPQNVGILAIETYVPTQFVQQSDLERFDGIPKGKYTLGLGQDEMSFTGDREDVNSLALTCVANLLEKYEIPPTKIGRLEVGTETLVDKSKSTKTVLMQLFEKSGNTNIEGVTTVNACYGGTAALFNALDWIEGSAWDGRYAIVVMADIAVYQKGPARPTSGCGAVALLVGSNAPLVVDSSTRSTYSNHVWDFYKPNPYVEYPTVDGRHSNACYLKALDTCYDLYRSKICAQSDQDHFDLNSVDFALFHSPYNKLVQKSFSRLFYLDYRNASDERAEDTALSQLANWKSVPLDQTFADRDLDLITRNLTSDLYKTKAAPACAVSKRVGNCYTASLYLNLASLVSDFGSKLDGKHVMMFAYGSGSMASMFSIHCNNQNPGFSLDQIASTLNLQTRLDARVEKSAEVFDKHMQMRENFHGKNAVEPTQTLEDIADGVFYLSDINDKYQRFYKRKRDNVVN